MSFTWKSPWISIGLALAVAVPLGIWAGDSLSGGPAIERADAGTGAEAIPPAAEATQPAADTTAAWAHARKLGDDAWYSAVVRAGSPSIQWPEDEEPDMWDEVVATGADAWDATAEASAAALDWTAESSVAAWDWTAESSGAAWEATVEAGAASWDWSADAAGEAADWTAGAAAAGWEATVDALDATGEAIGDLLE